MLNSHLRRVAGTRISAASLAATSLALAATVTLAGVPAASAQSTAQPDVAVAVSSLGASNEIPASVAGSLGSLAEPVPGDPVYAEYVALGDSYAAFGDQKRPADDLPQCARSLTSYPRVLAEHPAVGELTDATCGGATADHFARSQHPGLVDPQFAALSAETDLVTLSIGGNDIGFSTMVSCLTRRGAFTSLPARETCAGTVGSEISNAIARVYGPGGPVDAVYAGIAEAAPHATVITTQYLPLMPAEGRRCSITDELNPADVRWAREVTDAMNAAVDEAARRNGHVSVLPTDTVDRSVCASVFRRWTDFRGGWPTNAGGLHPTSLGQRAVADAIVAALPADHT